MGKIIKFNGGNPVVLCNKCRVILRRATKDEIEYGGDCKAEYCENCSK